MKWYIFRINNRVNDFCSLYTISLRAKKKDIQLKIETFDWKYAKGFYDRRDKWIKDKTLRKLLDK